MTDIILSTINARYIHTAFGLRYLKANLDDLAANTIIIEFTLDIRAIDIVEKLLNHQPKIIGFGIYIWNIQPITEVVILLKTLAPEIKIILGGPEISYETEQQVIFQYSDYIITGTGEISFKQLCQQLLHQEKPLDKIITGIEVPLEQLKLPYHEYTEEDIAHRIIYVEASRGCPFKCEFCLSALDKTAKGFDLESFLNEMTRLYQKGVRHFKFVDRTFNLKTVTTTKILEFFLQYIEQDKNLFLHFELIPDHLPHTLKTLLPKFPPHSLQFEIGVQSLDPEVQTLISRKQDNIQTQENLKWLRQATHTHLHVDLIFGLPGQDLSSFANDFNQLILLDPHEIQLGILKRLRGTPIIRHTQTYQLKFNPSPPYNILSTDRIDFITMQQVTRFTRYWDIVINSGRFQNTKSYLLLDNAFESFWQFSQWLFNETQQTYQIALARLFKLLHYFLINIKGLDKTIIETALLKDYENSQLKGLPAFYKQDKDKKSIQGNKRQSRHKI